VYIFFPSGATAPSEPRLPQYLGFTITLRHTTLSRTSLDKWSARRRDLYLTTYNTHNRQTSMPPAVCEPTIPASERPQTYALDGASTGIDRGTLITITIQLLRPLSVFFQWCPIKVCTTLNSLHFLCTLSPHTKHKCRKSNMKKLPITQENKARTLYNDLKLKYSCFSGI
jgi:hypothetical protein